MYPRNSASPPEIAIGAVVQISDGVVQTSGISISISQNGGAGTSGAGSTRVVDGIVSYTPTQAETNATEFTVRAYKSGSIPAAVTVVTSESTTAGQVVASNMRGTDSALLDANYTAPDSAAAIASAVVQTSEIGVIGSTVLDNAADIAALNDFDPSSQTVVASNMRGTDGANTVAPDNTTIAANAASIAALNDFDPTTQSVTASNMRGTDGANTVAPDNAGITGKIDAVDALIDTLLERLTEQRAGYLDKLNVTGDLANTDNASSFQADLSSIPTASQNASAVWSHSNRELSAFSFQIIVDSSSIETAVNNATADVPKFGDTVRRDKVTATSDRLDETITKVV